MPKVLFPVPQVGGVQWRWRRSRSVWRLLVAKAQKLELCVLEGGGDAGNRLEKNDSWCFALCCSWYFSLYCPSCCFPLLVSVFLSWNKLFLVRIECWSSFVERYFSFAIVSLFQLFRWISLGANNDTGAKVQRWRGPKSVRRWIRRQVIFVFIFIVVVQSN